MYLCCMFFPGGQQPPIKGNTTPAVHRLGKSCKCWNEHYLAHHNSLTAGWMWLNIKQPVCFLDLSLMGGRGAQKFFPALCRLRGQSPNSFPVMVLCSQLGWRERALTGSPNRPKLKEKMSATLPPRNVTSVTLLSFSIFFVFGIMATFSQLLLMFDMEDFD